MRRWCVLFRYLEVKFVDVDAMATDYDENKDVVW